MVVTEEHRRQHGQAEKAGGQTGELVEGQIQVHQMRQAGNRCGQGGEEAWKRVTLCIVKTVSLNWREVRVWLEAVGLEQNQKMNRN